MGPQVLRAYFQSNTIKGQRSSRGLVALEMPYGYKIGRKNPNQSVMHCGSKVMQRSARVNQRSNYLENTIWLPSFGGKKPLTRNIVHCWDDRSYRSCPGSTRGKIARSLIRWIACFSQPAGHALFTARSFFLSTEREYFIQFPKIFEIFRMGKPTLNRFLRKPAYVGTLFHT